MIKRRYDIGAIIREHRESLGIQQKAVAVALGVTQGYLSQIEGGRVRLADRHFAKLPPGIREPATRAALQELERRAKVIMCGA